MEEKNIYSFQKMNHMQPRISVMIVVYTYLDTEILVQIDI